jgi:hypothetical protein
MTRSPLRLAALAALALCTSVVAACGDDDGPSPSSRQAAVFVNEAYMEWDTTSWEHWNAGSNAYAAVVDAGFPVDTFSGLDVAAINAHVAGKDILFFPELNNTPPFTAEAIDSIRAFVNNGGTVVVFSSGNQLATFNTMFDLALTTVGDDSRRLPIPKMGGASDTPFGGGPATVPENDWTYYIESNSLPDGSIIAYGEPEGGNDAAVAVLPYGEGRIVLFGWSWGDGKPKGWQDGGWNELLSLTAGF